MGSKSRVKGHRRSAHLVAEINVTPMVDVMLVLLVIFMITAPLLTAGVSVDLPKVKASAINDKTPPLKIRVDAEGVFLEEKLIELSNLVPRLIAITGSNSEARIHVYGDKTIPYGQVMGVLGAIHLAGFTKAVLIVDPSSSGSSPPQGHPRK